MNKQEISRIEKIIGYKFSNTELLEQAFTHSSYANEKNCKDYERLEFLGDSILEFLTTEYLYRNFDENEGILSKMRAKVVSAPSLCKIVKAMGIHKYIRVGGSIGANIPDNVVADVFESIVAILYLDGGLESARVFVLDKLIKSVKNVREIYVSLADYKTMVQELYQAQGKVVKYSSREIKDGVNVLFEVKLIVDAEVLATSVAASKKIAEQNCAKDIIERNGGIL